MSLLHIPRRGQGRRAIEREAKLQRALRSPVVHHALSQCWQRQSNPTTPGEHLFNQWYLPFFGIDPIRALGPGGERGVASPSLVTEYFLAGGPSEVENPGPNNYVIPKNARMVMIVTGGSGACGGPGRTGATSTNKCGGGGGGSSGITALLIAARFLPAILYIYAASTPESGDNGFQSSVNDVNSATAQEVNTVVTSGSSGGVAGGTGGTTTAGVGGGGGGLSGSSNTSYAANGQQYSFNGTTGANGGADTPTAGVSITFGTAGFPGTSGAGGGSASSGNAVSSGGNITGAGLLQTLLGGAGVASTGNGNAGSNGFYSDPQHGFLYGSGGAGGGANATGHVGGAGGNGGWCSGGGGGGSGVTGGAGGVGGPGFVYIAWWP